MKNIPTLHDLLEVCLITYNRSSCLEHTLLQFKDSPFAHCRFTVLDNCSTDDTPRIAEKYRDHFPDYHIVRHRINIGGDSNYLRAVEQSRSYYTWIICDDDDFDFQDANQIISIIQSVRFDLIYVASRAKHQLSWDGFGETSSGRLIREGARYYFGCTFWPALIFKTALFDEGCFLNVPRFLPSLIFINKSVIHDYSLYISPHELVVRRDKGRAEMHPLHLYHSWVTNLQIIDDKRLRYRVIEQFTKDGFIKSLAFWVALDRSNRSAGFFKRIVDILFALSWSQRAKFLLLTPVMVIPIPKKYLIKARELVYRMMGHKDPSTLPPVEIEERWRIGR